MTGRSWVRKALAVGTLALLVGAVAPARAEEEKKDPTRGQWDSFLDGFRDAEDGLAGFLGKVDERSKYHFSLGVAKTYQWSFNNPSNGTVALRGLDPDHDSANLDFAQIKFTRPNEGWLPGFGVNLQFGTLARRGKSDWDGDGALAVGDEFENNDFDVYEAYLNWTVSDTNTLLDGVTFKAGKFATLMGAELTEPWNNFNYSRGYLFSFGPYTHTGGIVTVPVGEKATVTAGAVLGWDNVHDNNRHPSYIVNGTYTANDWMSFAGTVITGPEQTNRRSSYRTISDLVATIKPMDGMTVSLNYDWAHEDNLATWQGMSAILNYAWTDRLQTAIRQEWWEDRKGARLGSTRPGTVFASTATVKYNLTQHLQTLAEYRHDEGSRSGGFPAGNGVKVTRGQDTITFGMMWTFL
jgi:Putative beta-barrel porin-2, OmpL-like. bbp2